MHSCCPMSDFVIIRSHVLFDCILTTLSRSLYIDWQMLTGLRFWDNHHFIDTRVRDWEQQVVCSVQHFENYRSNYQVHFSIHVTAITTWTTAAIADKAFGVLACLHLNARLHSKPKSNERTRRERRNEKKEDRGNRMNEHVIKTNSIIT